MLIAYLFGSLQRGGTETLLLDVFRNASKNNLKAIGIYRKPGLLETDFLKSGIPFHKLPARRNLPCYLWQLRSLLKANGVDIAHAQQPIDALYAWLACIGTGIRVVHTFHGYDFDGSSMAKGILSFIIHRTALNIYVSETQRDYYCRKYGLDAAKQVVVYNGISFDKLDLPINQLTKSHRFNNLSNASISNLREELHLSADTILLGAIGNFNAVRDQFTICRFLKLLHDQDVDFHFVFAGKRIEAMGYLYDQCTEYIRQNGLEHRVTFLGSRNDVPLILKQLDAFIYSTDHDTFGIAVVEAMATGIPVFVNDWGVMEEITDGGKYATLYKTKDEQDLLRHFMLFLQDKEPSQFKANEASGFVREKYSIEKHISNLYYIYSLL